jgi:hypothetical protein
MPPSDVQLRDGLRMLIRPVDPGDRALLTGLFSEMSAETRYRRFFAAVREMDEARFAFLTELLSRLSWWRTAGSGWVWEACFSSA